MNGWTMQVYVLVGTIITGIGGVVVWWLAVTNKENARIIDQWKALLPEVKLELEKIKGELTLCEEHRMAAEVRAARFETRLEILEKQNGGESCAENLS